MTIEFQAPSGQVKKRILDYVRDKLMELYHRDKDIARAQVYFRDQAGGDKVCEIDLTIYGDSLFVHRKAGSFEQASREVLTELAEKVDEQVRKKNEPPDEIISTVKV